MTIETKSGKIVTMEVLEIIKNRLSVREYKENIPPDIDIKKILESARWAPSGLNNQPWRFLVIKDKAQKDKLAGFTKYGDIIKSAPIVICVFMDIGDSYNRDKDIMAIGEILNRKDEVVKYLGVDEDLELMAVVTVGYPAEKITKRARKSLESIIVRLR